MLLLFVQRIAWGEDILFRPDIPAGNLVVMGNILDVCKAKPAINYILLFPRSAWEHLPDAPRPQMTAERSGFAPTQSVGAINKTHCFY